MTGDEFVREHWKDYGAYMERKERIIEVTTTLYLAFVAAVLAHEKVWHDYPVWLLVVSAVTFALVLWFVIREMAMWSSAASMCNACQTMMTRWVARVPSPNELRPVRSREFAGVRLPKGLVDELQRRRTLRERWRRRYGNGLWWEKLGGAPFEVIVYGLIILWTLTLWGRVSIVLGVDWWSLLRRVGTWVL